MQNRCLQHPLECVHNAVVRRRFPQSACLAVACLVVCHPLIQAQLAAPSEMPVAQAVLQCPPPVVFPVKQIARRKILVVDLIVEGGIQMAIPDQDQIVASLKQRSYFDDSDGVASDIEERARRAWQEHGYFKVQVRANTTILASSPLETRISVTLQVDEGKQYRLSGITFKKNRAISSEFLRSLFGINDGDVFNIAQVSEGLEKLSAAYGQFGHLNSVAVPDTRINEENETISLDVDLDEGKRFSVSTINAVGLDEQSSLDAVKQFLLRPGDIYNQRLVDLSTKRLSTAQSATITELHRDEAAGTVAITVRFRHCPGQ